MSIKEVGKWSLVTLLVGLLPSVYCINQSYQLRQQSVQFEEEKAALSEENQTLKEEIERLSYVYDLAVEFSMDPKIVVLVDNYSREYMKDGGPEWRLIRTPEFMSYIMLSLIYVESKGNTHAVGDRGKARGLTQIWVSTAQDYGDVTAEQLHRPGTNLSFAFKHFHHLLKKYQGNLALTLYAWNRGSRKVDQLLRYSESPGNGYVEKVYQAALVNNRDMLINGLR